MFSKHAKSHLEHLARLYIVESIIVNINFPKVALEMDVNLSEC